MQARETCFASLWRENISKVKSNMEIEKVDLLIIFDPPNFHYLIGPGPYQTRTMYESSFGEYLVFESKRDLPFVFCNPFYHEFYLDRISWADEVHMRDDFVNFIRRLANQRKIQTSSEGPVALFELIRNSFRGSEVLHRPTVIEKARRIKTNLELQQIRNAAKIATEMMRSAVGATRVGVSEFDIAAEAEFVMRKKRADTFSFSTIASSGKNAGVMQEVLSSRKIRANDTVMIDLGAQKNCYNQEFTRTVEVRTSESLHRIVETVRESLMACIDAIRPGVPGFKIDHEARRVLAKAGLPDFNHPTGHGLGTSVWEYPTISRNSGDVIEEGMVLAVEPGAYLKGLCGVRLEENVVVTKKGCETLTKFPLINRK
jgi:Xaa-Pro dipeptidase